MLPPSDSFRHQELKLAEALSDIQAIEVPPPSYTIMPVTTNESFQGYGTDDEDDEDGPLPLAPITVHIDASIKIDGQANTILLPLPPPPTTPTSNPTLSPQPFSPPTLGSGVAQAGRARAERLTSTILTTLKDAGVFGGGGEAGWRQRPLDLHVNASVSVIGEKNVICAGIPRVGRKDGSGSGLQDGAKMLEGKEANRKRRAESEPAETRKMKRASR